MKSPMIGAASYLGPDGYANDLTGARRWPENVDRSIQQGDWNAVHWNELFDSDSQRFARMDWMSRLGLMAVELLDVAWNERAEAARNRVGICVETFHGALDTDVRFLRRPRPSVFTYALPSTVIGEICIRHRLRGPLLCLSATGPNDSHALGEATHWVQSGQADQVLCLRCEAVECDGTEPTASQLMGLDPAHLTWHAAALLVRPGDREARQYPIGTGDVVAVGRKLSIDKTSPPKDHY